MRLLEDAKANREMVEGRATGTVGEQRRTETYSQAIPSFYSDKDKSMNMDDFMELSKEMVGVKM